MRIWRTVQICLLGFTGLLTAQVPVEQQRLNPAVNVPSRDTASPLAPLRATSREVQFDVVVVDGKGHPVTGLKKEDFVVDEDGVEQEVRGFEEHHPTKATAQVELNGVAKLPPNTFTNFTAVPDTNASTVILIDALDTGLREQMYLHEQLIDYVKSVKPGTPIAIFLLDTRMRLIQGFTTDLQVLMEAVKSKRCGVEVPYFPSNGGVVTWEFKRDVRTGGMQVLGRYLAGFPGRKNLIWFTGYEPHKIIFNNAANNAFPDFSAPDFDMNEYAEALRLSKVSVYPVDAGGVRIHGGTGLDVERANFEEVAERTGGKAFLSDNGLKDIIAEVVDTGSHYYTITYAPTNREWHGQYRHIQVEAAASLQLRGLQLEYRHGYYARNRLRVDQNNLAKAKSAVTTGVFIPAAEGQPVGPQGVLLQRAKLESLQASMTLGAIPPTELVFNASVAPSDMIEVKAKKDALPPDIYLRPAYQNKPYREMQLLYAVDMETLRLARSPDGIRHGDVEFVAVVYSDQGDVVNSVITTATLDLGDAIYKKMLNEGFTMRQEIAVPVKGNYSLRLGVHDVVGDQVGAMEIPVEQIKPGLAGLGLAAVQ